MSWNKLYLEGNNGTQLPLQGIMVFDHAMIHMGAGFTHNNRHNNVAAAGVVDHLLKTGAHPVHMRVLHVESTRAPVSLIYYLSPTVSANGTLETIGNNNLMSSNTSECSIYVGPTVTDVGTQIAENLHPSVGGGGQSGIVGTLAGGEWILPPNTDFLIRFTNEDSQATDVVLTFFWYEPWFADKGGA